MSLWLPLGFVVAWRLHDSMRFASRWAEVGAAGEVRSSCYSGLNGNFDFAEGAMAVQ